MTDLLNAEPAVLVGLFVAAAVALVLLQYVKRLVAALVGGASAVMAVLLIFEWVSIEIETGLHQKYQVGLLIAAILCVGLSMVCSRWVAAGSATAGAPSEPEPDAAATPTGHDLPQAGPDDERHQWRAMLETEKDFDGQRQRVREQVARERAARHDSS